MCHANAPPGGCQRNYTRCLTDVLFITQSPGWVSMCHAAVRDGGKLSLKEFPNCGACPSSGAQWYYR